MARKSKVLNLAIIGLGHLHPRLYMPIFKAERRINVLAAVEKDDQLREAFCKDFGLRGYGDLNQALKREQFDIAAIFLPHIDCAAAAKKCAKCGIHLMVEKPMSSTAAGAAAIVKAARANKVKVTTGYCWRLHPVAREIKRLIEAGAIGTPVGAEGRCAAGRLTRYIDGHSTWMLDRRLSGGGPMYNLGVHWIDLLSWIFNDNVIEVCGQNVKVNKLYNIEDNSFAHLRFANGTIAALDISYTVPDSFPYGRDLYISIRGTKGIISWSPAYEGQADELFVCSDDPAFAGSPKRHIEFELQPTPGYSGFMGKQYVSAFVDSILNNAKPPITGDDGLAVLKVIEAIYKSAKEKKWVKVRK